MTSSATEHFDPFCAQLQSDEGTNGCSRVGSLWVLWVEGFPAQRGAVRNR